MRNSSAAIDWTDTVIRTLHQLWRDGLSTTEIGRRLGISKNAVIGKAHRLDLPSRPSPIRTDGKGTPRTPRRPAPPRLADIMPINIITVLPPARPPPPKSTRPARIAPAPPMPPSPTRRPQAPVGTKPCCWPIGDPGTPGFHFCAAPALTGKPYCDQHAQLAYRRVRRRADDAMAVAD